MSLFDTIKAAVAGASGKRGKDVNLPNERPVSPSDPRWAEHRRRLAEDVSGRFKKVADNVRQERIRELRRKGHSEADAIRKAHQE